MEGNNAFRPHAFSAFRQMSASRQTEVADEERMHTEMTQGDSQMSDMSMFEDFVPNSQNFPDPLLPYGGNFQRLMHAALFEPPPPLATTNAAALAPQPATPPLAAPMGSIVASATVDPSSTRPVVPSSLLGTGTSRVASPSTRPPPSGSLAMAAPIPVRPPIPRPLPTTPAPTKVTPSAVTHAAATSSDAEPGRKRNSNEIWSASDINVLLDYYEDKWISLNRGNFKAKHWLDIAREVNSRCGTEFTDTQCKYKWENLKRSFMKEKQKESASGAEPSRWEYFSRMSDLLSGTPKVDGLQGGFSREEFISPNVVSLAEDEEMPNAEEDPLTAPCPAAETEEEVDLTGDATAADNLEDAVPGPPIGQAVRGQKNKKRKSSGSQDGLGPALITSVGAFAAAYERVEMERIKSQLEIAKLMAPRRETPPDDE